jgi:ABC-type branched-subunit amino acid transport system substrate-binding protein
MSRRLARGEKQLAMFVALGIAALVGAAGNAAAAPLAAPAGAAPIDWKLAFAGPSSGPLAASAQESLAGVRIALEIAEREASGAAAKLKLDKLLEFDDADEPKKAEAAVESAKAKKVDLLFAAATGVTVESYVAKARKLGVPLMLVGSCGPGKPTLELDDPVFWLGAWPVAHAVTTATFLEMPCKSRKPALVVEETERGTEMLGALRRNLGERFEIAGVARVAPHGKLDAATVDSLKSAGADRLLLVGEPDLVDATNDALSTAKWKVPLFLDDGMLSAAAKSLWGVDVGKSRNETFLLAGFPRFASSAPSELADAWKHDHPGNGPDAEVPPRTLRSFTAARLLLQSIASEKRKLDRKELAAALREQRYDKDENERTIFDETRRSARMQWLPFQLGVNGPIAADPKLWFDADMGPLLRGRSPSTYQAEPNTKVVWFSYGEPGGAIVRTIEKDLTDLGLKVGGEGDVQMDQWILDDLMAHTLGKFNRLFLKNEDGSFVPNVSFAISATAEKPASLDPKNPYWHATIAGDDPEAGGRAWPGENRCSIYSTFMVRTMYKPRALVPALRMEDKQFFNGRYVWGTKSDDNLRCKLIRALIDGFSDAFSLTAAHECGHLAGLGHDEKDPRSLMNVTEGGGLFGTSACWIPEHAEILERTLGRWPVDEKARRRH